MLTLDRVAYSFGDGGSLAVADVSLAVARGQLVGVVGPNGAGKTTLLRLAAGFLAPTSGRVTLDDVDPRTESRRQVAKRVAYVPQEYALAFPFSVDDVVLMGRYPHQRALSWDSADDRELSREAMRMCDVAELGARRFDTLSGGEKRRVLLAQAFCQKANLVVLDEPTAALDPAHALAVFSLLAREKARTAALLVTHDLTMAVRFCDRLLVLERGRVAAFGSPQEVLDSGALARVFRVGVHVGRLADGSWFVVPT